MGVKFLNFHFFFFFFFFGGGVRKYQYFCGVHAFSWIFLGELFPDLATFMVSFC